MKRKNKKILIVSNEGFSQSSSNGRTLMNLLKDIPKEYLAQFYLHGDCDKTFCSMYFKISDKDALSAFLHRKKDVVNNQRNEINNGTKKIKKSLRNRVLRNIIWQSMYWWQKEFNSFLDKFKPEIVLLQAGDSPFMYLIARKISEKYKTKLIMFNTESYVLKKQMYSSISGEKFWHFLLMSSLKKQYKKFMKKADFCIYNMEELENAYQKKYPHKGKSTTLYTISELRELLDNSNNNFSLLYCGNLGVGRDTSLNELAKVLYEVDKMAKLDIYGKFISDESKKMICSNPNVNYHGFVDYSFIPNLMSKSSMVIHCENNDRLENLKYAFSTKIADCMASARPFLVYASRKYPFVKYLEKNNCAHIANDSKELKEILKKCINDKSYRKKYIENAKKIALKNHNLEENSKKLIKILQNI